MRRPPPRWASRSRTPASTSACSLQPQLEVAGGPDATLTSKNLFLRRTRFIVGGTLFKYFEFFFDTDYPNLFKNDSADTMAGTYKNAPGMNIQDAYITLKPLGDLIKLDAGFMLPPGSHNSSRARRSSTVRTTSSTPSAAASSTTTTRSAAPVKARWDATSGSSCARSSLGGHLEARAGVFQGVRNNPIPASTGVVAEVGAYNVFRFAGRVQVNVLDAEPGFFYAGDVSRHEEDPVVRRLLRLPISASRRDQPHVQVLRWRRHRRSPGSDRESSPRRWTSCVGTTSTARR